MTNDLSLHSIDFKNYSHFLLKCIITYIITTISLLDYYLKLNNYLTVGKNKVMINFLVYSKL